MPVNVLIEGMSESLPGHLPTKAQETAVFNPGALIHPEGQKDQTDKYAKEREKLRTYIEQKGEILSRNHEFAQFVESISKRLGVPEDTDFLVLDSEEFDAFFHPESNTVGFSRGTCRQLLDLDLELAEDHIAAILAHELAHADVLGDEYVQRLQGSYLERVKTFQNHAEEYRADAQAMSRLSKAGYNPRALIKMFRTLPLTHGRGDAGHPESIDRIRKLEDRLADDEHPLSHTTKELSAIESELMIWFTEDSKVYNQTELLLTSSPQELERTLLQTNSQDEFWSTHRLEQHIAHIATAKVLVARESEALDRLVTKLMIYESFTEADKFSNGEAIEFDSQLQSKLVSEKGGLSDEDGQRIFNASNGVDVDEMKRALASRSFREKIPEWSRTDEAVETGQKIAETERLIDIAIEGRFRLLGSQTLTEQERAFIAELRSCYESGITSTDLVLTTLAPLDTMFRQQKHAQAVQEARNRGVRDPEEIRAHLYNLRDEVVRNDILQQAKLRVACSFVEAPDPSQEIIGHLAEVIQKETDLPVEAATIIAETMLLGKEATDWNTYLEQQDRSALPEITKKAQKLNQNEQALRISPIRWIHQAFKESASMYRARRFASDMNYPIYPVDANGLKLLQMLPGWKLYTKGFDSPEMISGASKPKPAEIKLTLDEWEAIVDGKGSYSARSEKNVAVLKQYTACLEAGIPVSEELRRHVKAVKDEYSSRELDAGEIGRLIENSLWDPQELQKLINQGLEKLPHFVEARDDRLKTYHTLQLAHQLYSQYPHEKKNDGSGFGDDMLSPISLASRMLDLLTQDIKETTGVGQGEAFNYAIKYLTEQGCVVSYLILSSEAKESAGELTDEQLTDLIAFLRQRPAKDVNQNNFIESLEILAQAQPEDRKEVCKQIVSEKSITAIIDKHRERAVAWVTEHLEPTYVRDIILIGLIDLAPDELENAYIDEVWAELSHSSDDYKAHKSPQFDASLYYRYVKGGQEINLQNQAAFRGSGKLADNFDDLLTRRFNFANIALSTDALLKKTNWQTNRDAEYMGSPYQRAEARKLQRLELELFDHNAPLEQRVQMLQEQVPYPSVVRDIYLELLLRETLVQVQNDQDKVRCGSVLLPLFTKESSLRDGLASQVLKAELNINPDMIGNYDTFLTTLNLYLPEPSLARNDFLNQFENSIPLTPDQLRHIDSLRVTTEGKKKKDDDAPGTFIVNKLGELNREERVKTVLWLLGISQEKPLLVLKTEEEMDGHLDSLPAVVMSGSDVEKEIFFKRLFLGAEGIVDLETASPDLKEKAEQQRHNFIEALATRLVPENTPNPELGRKIFMSIIESSDPSHASRILIKLINRLSEVQAEGGELSTEELAALGLTELGVVGKKVAQSLAELEWVPESFKGQLRKAQSEGEVVPKRALLHLAEDAGLLDVNSPIRIVSFNELIGAASNKQGCMTTVEVTDKSLGLPAGQHEVVGKFKRPSAQKIENLDHDLRVLEGVVRMLGEEGYASSLPRDFLEQVSASVKRELDFGREKEFSDQIRVDVEKRNTKRKYPVRIPNIYFASDDLMLEQRAEGISLRQFSDRRTSDESGIFPEYGATSEKNIYATVATEAIAQLITTGNIHADLHPGNIFVDRQGEVTLIDLGMHESLNAQQRLNTIALIAGLVTGEESYIKNTLRRFGWDLGETKLNLERFKFADNTTTLLNATHQSQTSPPETVMSIIIAASKLGTYTSGFSNKELARMLISTVDKRELPAIITHLIRSGGREFLSS